MSTAQSGNRRASGALALLLLFLLLALGGGFAGYSVWQVKQLELDARQSQLEVLRKRQPPAAAASKEGAIAINPFLGEDNFALSANGLQKRVVGLIEATQGKLNTVGVDPAITGDAELARRVSVQVSAELTNDALQKVLYQIESGTPFAFVETLSMSNASVRSASGSAEAGTEPRLAVTMNIVGYRRKGSQ